MSDAWGPRLTEYDSIILFTGTATRTHSPFIRADRAERAHPSVICSMCHLCVLLPLVNPWNRMGDVGCWGSACPWFEGESATYFGVHVMFSFR